MARNYLAIKVLQRYWRLKRGLTMGAQAIVTDEQMSTNVMRAVNQIPRTSFGSYHLSARARSAA